MLNEELKDQLLQTKINYLNGYLTALGLLNSYSIIGMECKLFAFSYSAGDMEKCIQNNAYELFGVYPDDWAIEILKIDDWENKLQNELNASLKRRIPNGDGQFDYSENDLVNDLNRSIRAVNAYFIHMFKEEFITDTTAVYELKVLESGSAYRIVGMDLIVELDDNRLLLLQLNGID